MSDDLAMSADPEGRELRLRLAGALTVRGARDAERAFDDALYLNPGRGVIVDMSGVTSVDGDAVKMVMRWMCHAARERRSFRIVDAPEEIEGRMRLVGIISSYGAYPVPPPTA